jgi:hypothetical protein
MTTKPPQWGITILGNVSDCIGHYSSSGSEVESSQAGYLCAGGMIKVDLKTPVTH